jgi:hypothetical protein
LYEFLIAKQMLVASLSRTSMPWACYCCVLLYQPSFGPYKCSYSLVLLSSSYFVVVNCIISIWDAMLIE